MSTLDGSEQQMLHVMDAGSPPKNSWLQNWGSPAPSYMGAQAHACDSSVQEGGLQKRGEEWAVPAPGLLRKLLAAKAGLLLQVLAYHVLTRILLSTGAVWVLLRTRPQLLEFI